MNITGLGAKGFIPGGGMRNTHALEKQEPVTAALVAIVVFGTGLVFILLMCYACVLRRLCCPQWGLKSSHHHHHPRSTTTQQTSCDITKFDTLTVERSPS